MIGSVAGAFHSFTDTSGGGVLYVVGAIIGGAKGLLQTEYLSNLVQNNVGIPTNSPSINFSIYPNPVSNKIHVASSETTLTIELFNTNGKIVLSTNQQDKDIDVTNIPAGEYLMKISILMGYGIKLLIINH